MIIALYGKSSCGKTTIAKALRSHFSDCEIRHCGEIVKARALDLHVQLHDLEEAEHRAIDSETCSWCEGQTGNRIVEGRYLHNVLSGLHAEVRLIEIACSDDLREQRWAIRMKRGLGPSELCDMDASDFAFAAKMYCGQPRLEPELRIDTDSATVDECVKQIQVWLSPT
jgi:chloramphenicol 3-O-phosphotransferase